MRTLISLASCWLLLWAAPLAAKDGAPMLDGLLSDGADILSIDFESEMNDQLAAIEARTGVRLLLITHKTMGGADDAVVFESWERDWADSGFIGRDWAFIYLSPLDRELSFRFSAPNPFIDGAERQAFVERDLPSMVGDIGGALNAEVAPFLAEEQWEDGLRVAVRLLGGRISDRTDIAPPDSEAP